jgi:hypothetical protein
VQWHRRWSSVPILQMSRIKTIILGLSQKVVWPCSCHLQHTTHCQNCFATGAIPRPEKCNDTGDAVTCQHCTCRGSNSSYMTLYQNYSTTRASITRSKDDPKILTNPPTLSPISSIGTNLTWTRPSGSQWLFSVTEWVMTALNPHLKTPPPYYAIRPHGLKII